MDNKLIYNKAASLATASDRESYKEMNFIYKFIKRVLDIVCSILGIIVLSPILVIVSILIKLESKGPIIFKQLRAGKGSKPFYIYKFRSMKIETPNIATNDFTDSHVYITRIGKIIRKTSKKKFRAKVQETKKWLRKRMHSNVTETIKLLNIKLIGHYRYYGITDNIESLRQYYEVVAYMLFKTLNRRTQRNKYSYKEYYEKIEKKIVRPRIYQDIIKMAYAM